MTLGTIKRFVSSQFSMPSLPAAAVFFLLPYLFWLIFQLVFGFSVNYPGTGLSVVFAAISWLLSSIVIFFLLAAFKGKAAKGKFFSAMASFSSIYAISAIAGLVIILMVHAAIPGFVPKLAELQGQGVSLGQMVSVVSALALPSREILAVIFLAVAAIILAAACLDFYVVYRIFASAKETSKFSNLVFAVIGVGGIMFIDFLFRLVLSSVAA